MSISYDPMTGEPIETPDETEVTEAVENVADAASDAVDQAAEDVSTEAQNVAQEAGAVAESAAESVNAAAENVSEAADQTERRFDPMTGEPIDPSKASPAVSNTAYSSDAESKKGGFDPKFIIFGVIGLAIIAAIVFVLTQVLFSKRVRVEKAIAKTMNVDSQLFKDGKNLYNILKGKSYSVTATIDADDYGSASGSLVVDDKDKQVSAKVEIEDIPEFSVLAGIDSKSVKLEVPEFSDYLFVYNYTEDKNGYITDMMSDSDIESLDSACKVIYEYSAGSDEYTKKVAKLTRDYEKKLKWKKTDAKTYKVNDKKVKCKGYTTTIEKDLMLDYWDDFTDLYLEEFDDLNKEMKNLADTDLKDSFKDVRDELKSMKDIDVSFYIYKGALAAIDIDAGKNGNGAILFKGGDYRAQNIVIEADGDEVFELKGSKNKDKESYTLCADGEDLCELTYDTKKGVLEIEYEDWYDSYDYEFNIKSSGSSFTISSDEMEVEGEDVSFALEINNSGKIQKYTNKDEFDLGNADEDDFEDLIESIDMDELGDLAYMF